MAAMTTSNFESPGVHTSDAPTIDWQKLKPSHIERLAVLEWTYAAGTTRIMACHKSARIRRKPRNPHLQLPPRHHRRGRAHQKVRRRPRPDPLSPRAQRLPPHRPRQGHLPRLRPRRRVRRQDQPALRRHQSRKGRAGVRRLHPERRPLARLRVGAPLLRLRLLSPSSTSGPSSSSRPARPTSTISPPTRFASTAAPSPSPAKTAPIATAPSKKISTSSRA